MSVLCLFILLHRDFLFAQYKILWDTIDKIGYVTLEYELMYESLQLQITLLHPLLVFAM